MRFRDRVVIVTGAAHGIGAAAARAFGAEGARVALLDVDGPGAEAVAADVRAAGGEAEARTTDVTAGTEVRAAIAAVAARWGRIDVLVNNAGGFPRIMRTDEIEDEEFDRILRFNVTSAFLCTKAVLPPMRARRAGRIVNLSSVVARSASVLTAAHYAAAKAAILGLTRHLARELAPEGITVNAVAPGTTGTERVLAARTPEATRALAESIPLRRLGEARDIADAILYLASDAARYVTGATLDVNGGLSIV